MPTQKSEPIVPAEVYGRERLLLLQSHRLIEFERVFDLYLRGRTSAEHVSERAKLMLKCGLPGAKKHRRG